MHCTKLVLEVYQFYDREHKYGLYNSNSIKYTMLCAAAEKDMHTSHTYHCHEHDAHKEHTHGRIFFRYRAQQIIDISY